VTAKAAPDFLALYGTPAEAVGEAHGRVNLIGDHTDYNDGFVLPTAIPQTTVVQMARRPSGPHIAYSANLGRTLEFGVGPELTDFARYVGGCLNLIAAGGVEVPPLAIRIESSVPIGSGLSSSAALEVATLRALDSLLNLSLRPLDIARAGQRVEVEFAGVASGIMDQMAAVLASTDRMLFLDTRNLEYRLLPLPAGSEVIVVDSGEPRALATSAYNTRRDESAEAARLLGISSLRDVEDISRTNDLASPLRERARHVISENQRVLSALTADAETFGALMNASHTSLKVDYAVSTDALDALAAFLRDLPGVFGARLTGAGFGGACVALASAGSAAALKRRVEHGSRGRPWRVVVPAT
jgi:galactokinase